MRIRVILSFLCVTTLAAGLVYAAPPAQIRVQVNLVNLFVTVRDKHKAVISGLKQDDFQVFEDGQLQEITNFSAESNLPITLGILIDTSGSEYYMLSALKEAASRFRSRNSGAESQKCRSPPFGNVGNSVKTRTSRAECA